MNKRRWVPREEYKRTPLLFSHNPFLCNWVRWVQFVLEIMAFQPQALPWCFLGIFGPLLFFKLVRSLWVPCILDVCSVNLSKLELGSLFTLPCQQSLCAFTLVGSFQPPSLSCHCTNPRATTYMTGDATLEGLQFKSFMLLTHVASPLSVKGSFLFFLFVFIPNIDVVFFGERYEGVRVVDLAHMAKL